jgi:hypothetical protein
VHLGLRNRCRHCRPTPKGASWINQIETWFGIATPQAIRRGSFSSLAHLIRTIHDSITHWNEDAEPFTWTATADDIIEKVAILDRDFRKLVDNNQKYREQSISCH